MAIATTLSRSHRGLLVDVSSTGVRLRGDDLPLVGEDLVVSVEDVRAFGTVVWSDGGECGVSFDVPLPAGELQSLRHRAAQARGLPPDVRAAFENWMLGPAR